MIARSLTPYLLVSLLGCQQIAETPGQAHTSRVSSVQTNATTTKEQWLADRQVWIKRRPIRMSVQRRRWMLEYLQNHSDKNRSDLIIQPRIIVLHWTATATTEAAFRIFDREKAKTGRSKLYRAGLANVSVPFLIGRDGTVYQLMPENLAGRHCIGLNHNSIGIENVGGPHLPLSAAQLASNLKLIRTLREIYKIEKVIGHSESKLLNITEYYTEYYTERDPDYFAIKPDPGAGFLARLRTKMDWPASLP